MLEAAIPVYQQEFELGKYWRTGWIRLANKFEYGRLQSKQERIERRAFISNKRVGQAMANFDAMGRSNSAVNSENSRRQRIAELMEAHSKIDAELATLR